MNGTDHSKVARHRKRAVTSARKEQNRIAQKAYRQRQKEILRNLQQGKQKHGHRHHELRPRQSCSIGISTPVTSDVASLEPTVLQRHGTGVPVLEQTAPQLDILDAPASGPSNEDEICQIKMSAAMFVAGVEASRVKRLPVYGSMGIPFCDFGDCSNLISDAEGANSHPDDILKPNEEPSVMLRGGTGRVNLAESSAFQPQLGLLGSLAIPLPPSAASTGSYLTSHMSALDNATNDFGDEVPVPISQESSPIFGRQLARTASWNRPPPLIPNLYTNLLTPAQTSVISALLQNSRCLNIPLSSLMTNLSCSPFYRPATLSDDAQALLSSISNSMPNLPPHLQPTLPQVLFPHQAYLDLLPFPVLKARAVAWAAATPRLLDPTELKMDIAGGGLICWREERGAGGGGGQPWDLRSWSVAPWFLRKWRLFLS